VFAVLIVAVLAYTTTQPDIINVSRSASIQAPPETIRPLIDDFHHWTAWSPWEKRDPNLQRTFSGAAKGKGAVYEWNGNNDVGQGRMEVLDSDPSKVTIQLDFIKPVEGHNITEFRFAPSGGATNLTWSMNGPATFLTKVMCVFIDMDDMIGPDFEAGLANLKSVAESKKM
jgi:Polyketide cyclase / dehydrase and lipid transport